MKVWNSLVKVNIYLNSKYSTVAIAVDKPLIILVWRLKDQSKHIFKNWYKSIAKNKKQFKMGKGPEETFFFFQRRRTTGQQEHEIISTSLIVGASLVTQRLKRLPAMWETWVRSLGREDPLEKEMATPVFLSGESRGWRSLVGYSPWGRKESGNRKSQPE